MNRYTHQFLPILMGVTAVLLSIAAIVVIVGQVRGDRRDNTASTSKLAQTVGPALQEFGRGLESQLGQTYLGVSVSVQPNGGGLMVQSVMPSSPAATAGVEVGDVITALNGTKVTTADGLRGLLDQIGAGKEYTLTVTRSGKSQDLTVHQATLGGAAEQWFQGMFGNGPNGGGPMPRFGGPRRAVPTGTPGPQA
jgi:membrane-associated protease RseP (regulator of RpoE activity)